MAILNRLRSDSLHHRQPGIIGEEHHYMTAVLVPLIYNQDQELCVVLEKRALTLRRQAGEICFPGGGMELGDIDPLATAIRECCEELRLDADDIEYLFPLDILLTPFNLKLYPYVGYIENPAKIDPSPAEVDSILIVPLNWLLTHPPREEWIPVSMQPGDDYPYHLIPGGRDYPWFPAHYPHLFYEWEGAVIWGLTARILDHFLHLITPLID